ncbi:MAG: VPLPA-CTERM sorting domain-containing protein [Halioglobus sp.]
MLVWTPFEDETANEPNYVAYLLPRNDSSRTNYYEPFDYGSGDHTGAQQYALFKSVSSVSAVPLPAAVWLFASTLLGLGIVKRRKS